MVQFALVLKKGDWVVFTKVNHLGPEGEEGCYKQLSRAVFVSADGEEIRLETPLSVGPLHYLVAPTDKLDKVQIFDEPRRRHNVDMYAQTVVNDINNPANMRSASSYFKRIHP